MEVIVGHMLVAPVLALLISIIIVERLVAMAQYTIAAAHGADDVK